MNPLKKDVFGTDSFWSAVKRKDVFAVVTMAFEACGEDEAAEISSTQTRVTDAAIIRIRAALTVNGEEVVETEEEEVVETEEVETTDEPEEVVNGSIEEHEAIIKAIKKGKGHKALKLIKKAKKGGARGSVLKDLERQAKAL